MEDPKGAVVAGCKTGAEYGEEEETARRYIGYHAEEGKASMASPEDDAARMYPSKAETQRLVVFDLRYVTLFVVIGTGHSHCGPAFATTPWLSTFVGGRQARRPRSRTLCAIT